MDLNKITRDFFKSTTFLKFVIATKYVSLVKNHRKNTQDMHLSYVFFLQRKRR